MAVLNLWIATDKKMTSQHKVVGTIGFRCAAFPLAALRPFIHDDLCAFVTELNDHGAEDDITSGELSARLIYGSVAQTKCTAPESLDECARLSYENALALERHYLKELLGTSRFSCGLIVSGHDWTRYKQTLSEGKPNKKTRKVERTLLRFLMRAIGRPTPFGLWAGCVSASMRVDQFEKIRIEERSERVSVKPCWHSVNAALQRRLQSEEYRMRGLIQINPTYQQSNAKGSWINGRTGAAHSIDLARARLVEEFIGNIGAKGLASVEDTIIALQLAHNTTLSVIDVEETIRDLFDADLLQSAIHLPYELGIWQGMREVQDMLLEDDIAKWKNVASHLASCCEELEDVILQGSPEKLEGRYKAIRWEMARTLNAFCGYPVVEFCDVVTAWSPPFSIAISRELSEELGYSLDALCAKHASLGLAEAFRRAYSHHLLQMCEGSRRMRDAMARISRSRNCTGNLHRGSPLPERLPTRPTAIPITVEDILKLVPEDGDIVSSLERYRRVMTVETGIMERDDTPIELYVAKESERLHKCSTVGSSLVEIVGTELGMGLLPRSLMPQVGLYNRSADRELKDNGPMTGGDGKQGFVEASYASAVGLRVINSDIEVDCTAELARKWRQYHLQELLGADIEWGAVGDRPYLHLRNRPELGHLTPLLISGAMVDERDVASTIFFRLAASQGWEFTGFGFPVTNGMVNRSCYVKPLFSEGHIVAQERWIIDAETMAGLARLSGFERFKEWRRNALNIGLPRLVRLNRSDWLAPLLIVTDSPILVELIFCGLHKTGGYVVAENASCDDSGLRFPSGEQYFCEFGVNFQV